MMTSSMSSPVIGQEPLSIIQLWRKFRSMRPDFVSSFAAYQHCRSRGWVPKGGGGAKYGVDFSKTHTLIQTHAHTGVFHFRLRLQGAWPAKVYQSKNDGVFRCSSASLERKGPMILQCLW